VFAVVLISCAAAETLWPRRSQLRSRFARWPGNLGITLINSILLRLVVPGAATGVAVLIETVGWGFFNNVKPAGTVVAFIVSLLLLDFAMYVQHRLFHKSPWLWRLHRMHHADIDLDFTTGARFHPLEILISIAIKALVIALLGPPVVAVLFFEVLLSSISIFNHSNLRIAPRIDNGLRRLIVTPDMHRVHHSILGHEMNSNFGVGLQWWDRCFATYIEQPRDGHADMTLGLVEFRDAGASRIDRLLLQPFRKTEY